MDLSSSTEPDDVKSHGGAGHFGVKPPSVREDCNRLNMGSPRPPSYRRSARGFMTERLLALDI
jgi:hypothetical protein